MLDTYVNISWAAVVIPFTSSYGRFWVGVGAISLDLMIAVFVSSLLRARMRPGTWRAIHWLAYLSWPVALAHTFGMGTDAGEGWVIVLGVVCVVAVGGGAGLADPPGRPPSVGADRPRVGRRCAAEASGALGDGAGQETRMSNVSEAPPITDRYRLLGYPTDLAGHVAALGPVPLPSPGARGWREAFVSTLEASGLSGRGGAGFSAAIKLAVAHAAGGPAARSWSTPWRGSRPATRTSSS